MVKKGSDKTPYELLYGHTPNVSHFKVFGNKYYIEREKSILESLIIKVMKELSLVIKLREAFKCFNKRIKKIMECVNVKVDDYSNKSNNTSKSDVVDEEKLVIIELEVQNDAEQNSAKDATQPVKEKEEEEQEEASTSKPIIPRYIKLNHFAD